MRKIFGFWRNKEPKVGVDVVENRRFEDFRTNREHAFLAKVFAPEELSYCFSFEDPVPHLAGTFAAKEAVSKALGVKSHPFAEIAILRDQEGRPHAYHNTKKLRISISISHSEAVSVAIAAV